MSLSNASLVVGLIGLGYWGPNILRNCMNNDNYKVKWICDIDENMLFNMTKKWTIPRTTTNFQDILKDGKVDAIFIATPVKTHENLIRMSLQNNKHVFVEKPMCLKTIVAEELIELAKQKGLTLMCDHTYCYHPATKELKKQIESKELGDILYIDSTRINLGLFQSDINVVWDLCPHDISIMLYILEPHKITSVSAHGFDLYKTGYESIAYILLKTDNNIICHIHVNWLSPAKVRNIIVGATKKMIVWDDNNPDEKIKIYNKGIQVDYKSEIKNNMLITYRNDSIFIPKLSPDEPLSLAIKDFYTCIMNPDELPISNDLFSAIVVKILEAINLSMSENGREIPIFY